MADSSQLLKAVSGGGGRRISTELPELPKFPESFLKRFPEMEDWWKKFQEYEKKKAAQGQRV